MDLENGQVKAAKEIAVDTENGQRKTGKGAVVDSETGKIIKDAKGWIINTENDENQKYIAMNS